MHTSKFVVFTNPGPGREKEYNDWYTNVHLPEVLKIPGIVGAQRFRLSAAQNPGTAAPHRYLAIYDCDSRRLDEVIQTLKRKAEAAELTLSDALAEGSVGYFFDSITELVTLK